MVPSKTLIDKMDTAIAGMREILNNRHLTAEVQVADINLYCWLVVQLALELQRSVADELRGLE